MLQQAAIGRSTAELNLNETLTVVVEMSLSSWLIAGLLPGVERRPLKKLAPDEGALLALIERWRQEAARAGRTITRVVLAYESGRDGFWLARWLRTHGIEAHVIHAGSVAVSRDRRRAKTDRLDTALLMRVLLGCVERPGTAPWRSCRASRTRMPSARHGNGKTSSVSAPG